MYAWTLITIAPVIFQSFINESFECIYFFWPWTHPASLCNHSSHSLEPHGRDPAGSTGWSSTTWMPSIQQNIAQNLWLPLTQSLLTPFQCVLGYQPPLFPWFQEPSDIPAVNVCMSNIVHVHLQKAIRKQWIHMDKLRYKYISMFHSQ